MLLMAVREVGPGAGTNGGRYAWDVSGPGGTVEFLVSASVIHKQIDPVAMTPDLRFPPGNVSPAPAMNPFGFDNEGMTLNSMGAGMQSGAGGVLPLPLNARGVVGMWALLAEQPGGPVLPAGMTYQVRIDFAWKRSPWQPPTPGAPSNVPVADGTGQGTGVFRGPGGAVPPGLRVPSDIATSVVYTPGGGTAPPNAKLNVLGIGFEIAVVEGGYALLTKESLHASEEWRTSHAQPVERFLAMDVWAMDVTKAVPETLQFTESWAVELNPGVAEFEALELDGAWTLDATKQIDESLEVAESWDLVLNP